MGSLYNRAVFILYALYVCTVTNVSVKIHNLYFLLLSIILQCPRNEISKFQPIAVNSFGVMIKQHYAGRKKENQFLYRDHTY